MSGMTGLGFAAALLAIFIVLGLLYGLDKRKRISHVVGYRTRRSTESDINWRESQKLFYVMAIICQVVVVAINSFVSLSIGSNALIMVLYMAIIYVVIELKLSKMDQQLHHR